MRLLDTLAASLSVALENARLFDETKRLLAETNERAAELAIINERPAAAWPPSSTCRRCTTWSATRSRRSSTPRSSTSGSSTSRPARSTSRTRSSAASASRTSRWPIDRFRAPRHARPRQPLVINEDVDSRVDGAGSGRAVLQGEPAEVRGVRAADRAGRGARRHLAPEPRPRGRLQRADVRLLTTLASSLSVALENARLIDETRQRAAELAIVNELGQATGRAARPRRADRARRRADARHVPRRHRLRRAARRRRRPDRLPVLQSRTASATRRTPLPLGEGLTSRILQTREPLLLNRARRLRGDRQPRRRDARAARTSACRSSSATRRSASISVQSIDQEGRFGEDDVRLLSTHRRERRHGDPERPALPRVASAGATRWRPSPTSAARSRRRSTSGAVLERIAERAEALLVGGHERRVPAEPDGRTFRAIVAPSARSPSRSWPTRSTLGEGIIGTRRRGAARGDRQRRRGRPAHRASIPGTDPRR